MNNLLIKQPYIHKELHAPDAVAQIDHVAFDRPAKRATFIVGVYPTPEKALIGADRLDALTLIFESEAYDNLIAEHPDIFTAIVSNVSALAVAQCPEILEEN